MVNISLREQFTNSYNIQLLSLKLVLPLSFARFELKVEGLEFKFCKGQPFLNWLFSSVRVIFYRASVTAGAI
jgi:hypothetical protein